MEQSLPPLEDTQSTFDASSSKPSQVQDQDKPNQQNNQKSSRTYHDELSFCKLVNPPLSVTFGKRQFSETLNEDKQKNVRGPYNCNRCGVPKKGHKCPYGPQRKKELKQDKNVQTKDIGIQVELDKMMAFSNPDFNLKIQGYPESYAVDKRKLSPEEEEPMKKQCSDNISNTK